MKKCKMCKEEKETDKFNGRSAVCRICKNAEIRKKYDPEKERIRKKNEFEKNKEHVRKQKRESSKRYRENNREKCRAKGRRYYHKKKASGELNRQYDKQKSVAASTKWRKENYDKFMAAHYLRKAVKKGQVMKSDVCYICGQNKPLEGHHFDYKRPLDVIWCCRSCHCQLDRIRRIQENI